MNPSKPFVELIDPEMVAVLRNLTPEQRLKTAFGMWDSAQVMIRGVVQQLHPDWTVEQVNRETARRLSHGATENVPH